MRGNRHCLCRLKGPARSIPACAGEPKHWGQCHSLNRVYPRVCGGTDNIPVGFAVYEGLSPRVRGNLLLANLPPPAVGSIPACAGEPRNSLSMIIRIWVYPRVCGGTVPAGSSSPEADGLSPRVRGNPGPGDTDRQSRRSIPACAGEPWTGLADGNLSTVYPRVCGGTGIAFAD